MKRSLSIFAATVLIAILPLAASAQVSFGVGVALGGPGWGVGIAAGYPPPALPAYTAPAAPYPNWQLVPGYWAWGGYGYYWVPAYWTAAPAVGLYWTPGYWGYLNGAYNWSPGYWGPTVGFYGGINYGFGYFGTGFVGGFWSGGAFNYNTAVVNVNRTVIRNTYVNRTVIARQGTIHSRVSFNGGRGGVRARPTAGQLAARRAAVAETTAQRDHERVAARDRTMLATVNHGHPHVVAVTKPLSASHRPAGMHAITAADRRTAQRTMHHNTVVAAQHNAPASAVHHQASAPAMHRDAPVSAAHHNAPVSASHHYAPISATQHTAPAPARFAHPQSGGVPRGGGSGRGEGGGRPPSL
jgi:hypothetical protein